MDARARLKRRFFLFSMRCSDAFSQGRELLLVTLSMGMFVSSDLRRRVLKVDQRVSTSTPFLASSSIL